MFIAKQHLRIRLLTALSVLLFTPSLTFGEALTKNIYLVKADDTKTPIGQLSLSNSKDGKHEFSVQIDETRFGDFFLSMRPFKCITEKDAQLCHQPYPYENRRTISKSDLTDLEYDLLFIRRSPSDYGINPWFGVYYKMSWDGSPKSDIEGVLHETNIDLLVSPPEEGNYRPIPEDEVHEAELEQHYWPRLIIQ